MVVDSTVHLIILCMLGLSCVFAVAGLITGLSLQREVAKEVKDNITASGMVIGIIAALCMFGSAVFGCDMPIAYEVCGIVLALSVFGTFLAAGLWIGPYKGT